MKALSLMALCALSAVVEAATISLTSVEDLDFTGVVKAYDFTATANNDTTFDIGGVTFTRHNWQLSGAKDGLEILSGGHGGADNQGSSSAPIVAGGSPADQANLSSLLGIWNIGAGSSNGDQMTMRLTLPDGDYKLQYLVGKNNDRGNDLFDISAGAVGSGNEILLGSFEVDGATDAGNLLITSNVTVSGGQLDLSIYGDNASGDARPIISGLIVSQVPEPTTAALVGIGCLGLLRRRRT